MCHCHSTVATTHELKACLCTLQPRFSHLNPSSHQISSHTREIMSQVTSHSLPLSLTLFPPHWSSLSDRELFPFTVCLELSCITASCSCHMVTLMASVADTEMHHSDPPSEKNWLTSLRKGQRTDSLQQFAPVGLPLLSSCDTSIKGSSNNDCTVEPGLGHFLPMRDHSVGHLYARAPCWSDRKLLRAMLPSEALPSQAFFLWLSFHR